MSEDGSLSSWRTFCSVVVLPTRVMFLFNKFNDMQNPVIVLKRIILSRKGFDSSSGGVASPIFSEVMFSAHSSQKSAPDVSRSSVNVIRASMP